MNLTNLQRQLDEAKSLSAPKTAILWGHEGLPGMAVESILKSARNWNVVRMLGSQDDALLIREVEKIRPDIVFLIQGNCAGNFQSPTLLIQNFPEVKIIVVNPGNNLVEVYNKQRIWIQKANDLLAIIDDQPTSASHGGES